MWIKSDICKEDSIINLDNISEIKIIGVSKTNIAFLNKGGGFVYWQYDTVEKCQKDFSFIKSLVRLKKRGKYYV